MDVIKHPKNIFNTFIILSTVFLYGCSNPNEEIQLLNAEKRPNILLIVADDLGYADLGAFGGEINTPNINSIADDGLLMTNFYTASTCSPTRGMLLTGTDHHLVGLGNMNGRLDTNQLGKKGYETYLNEQAVTVSSLLRDSGYHTYMTGKWHLGYEPEFQPQSRGFEKSFVLLQGGASHFNDRIGVSQGYSADYIENGKQVILPDNFYSSNFYTDKMINYLKEDINDDKPFFAYLAYTAPHWPLQVPDEDMNLYKGYYDLGYEHVRQNRIEKLKRLGIIDETIIASMAPDYIKDWNSLSKEDKNLEIKKMEIFAAMVDNLDRNVGRVIEYLKKTGQYQNTFVFFMSDNGAEGNDVSQIPGNKEWLVERFDNSLENMGKRDSYIYQGAEWARVSSTPYRDFKTFVSEGGIKAPAILKYPGISYKGAIDREILTAKDITPTFLELAGVTHPGTEYNGRKVYPLSGKSALPHLNNMKKEIHSSEDLHAWEFLGRQAVRKGNWKMKLQDQPYGQGEWELYNISEDPTENNNLSAEYPAKIKELKDDWEEYKVKNNIIMPINGENTYALPN